MKSFVSVVIPTYNRPQRLKKAIKSVLNQTYQDFEIIVVDDGDKESAEELVASFSDERIKYIKHKKNLGGGAARNTGIKNANGNYLAFLDDDDEWYPEKLEKQIEIMEKHEEEIGFVVCAIELQYEGTNRLDRQKFKLVGINNYYESIIGHRMRTLTSALLIKRCVLVDVGGFDERFPSSQEWELMIRISKKYNGYCMNNVLVKMNFLKGEHIGGNLSRRIAGRELLLKKHYSSFVKRKSVLSKYYFQLGIFTRDNKDFRKARKYFLKAILTKVKIIYVLHFFSMFFGGLFYKLMTNNRKYEIY